MEDRREADGSRECSRGYRLYDLGEDDLVFLIFLVEVRSSNGSCRYVSYRLFVLC